MPGGTFLETLLSALCLVGAFVCTCCSGSTAGESAETGGSVAVFGGTSGLSTGGGGAGGAPSSLGGAAGSIGGTTTQGGAASTGVVCGQAKLLCKMAAPACAALQVPEMTSDGTCYTGNCVPIANCDCAAPEDCPDNSQYTCNNTTRRCTPYLN